MVANNYQSSAGKVDIVMLEKNTLCFIQVRHERYYDPEKPSIDITSHEQRATFYTAESFVNHQRRYSRYTQRFDVLVISPGSDDPYEFHWIKQAF